MDSLPPEVISKILMYLETEDLLNARLVNKNIYQQSCVYPVNRRLEIKLNTVQSLPKLYQLRPKHVRIERVLFLSMENAQPNENDFKNLESLCFDHSRINSQGLKHIISHSSQTIRALEFVRCDFALSNEDPCVELPQLTRLKIYNCEASESLFAYNLLTKMTPNLKEFIFRYPYPWSFRPFELSKVLRIVCSNLQKYEEQLELLNLGCPKPTQSVLQFLKLNFQNLRTLKLTSDFRKPVLLQIWKEIGKLRLETLKITFLHAYGLDEQLCGGLTSEFIQEFKDNLHHLRHLCLNNFIIDDECFDVILKIPNLKILVLKNCFLNKITTIFEMKLNTNMRVLKIKDSRFHVEYNVFQRMTLFWPNIKYLDLSNSEIKNADFKHVCLKWAQLEALRIYECDHLAEADMELQNLSNLKYLNIGRTHFSDRICDIIKFPKLKVLHLFRNITTEGLRILGENNPALEVVCPDTYNMIDFPSETFDIRTYFPNCPRFECKCKKHFRGYLYSL